MADPLILADPMDYGNAPGAGPLRVGGQEGVIPSQPNDLPSTPSASAKRQMPGVVMCRDLFAGNERVRSAAQRYLPQAPGEDAKAYYERLVRSVFFNAFRRTVEGLTGMVFQRNPKLGDDVPPQIVEHWENIDLEGTHGDVFVQDRMVDAMIDGHVAILVDFPATGGTQTAGEERVIRPYWVPILKDNILSWRTTKVNGYTVLAQLVVKECVMVPDGIFGEREQERYRVHYNDGITVGFKLLEVTKDRRVIVVDEGIYGNQVEIPIAEVTTSGKKSIFESDPPLLDLAYLNIAHYQQASDEAYSRYKTCIPILHLAGHRVPTDDAGNPQGEIVVGANTALVSPDPSAKAEYVAHSGNALADCQAALNHIESQMGTLALAMLAPQKRSAETAEAKRLDKSTSDSSLSTTARGLQDAIERALGFHARYLKLPSGGSIEINRDFDGLAMDPAVMGAFAALLGQGLPWEIALAELQRGRRIAEDVDVETVALEIASARAADDQRRREEMQARLDAGPDVPPA